MVMKTIPNLKGRLESWVFKTKFNSDVASLRPDIESVIIAAKELKESKKFSEFLSVVLAIGNFLNAKGNKKDAYGFKLNSLHKLKETRSADGKQNLLTYLVTIFH